MRVMHCPYCCHMSHDTGIGAVHCGPHRDMEGGFRPAVRMRELVTLWERTEFGHSFLIVQLPMPDSKGRKFRLYDNGTPALGGQWHYTVENAIARARYVLKGDYASRISYLEQRVKNLERELHHDH